MIFCCCWETLLRHFVPSTFFRPAHAKTHSSSFPEVANTVDKSTYVDDVLDSCETTQSAQHLRRQLSDLLAMIAGLKFREWSCNEPVVIEDILNEGRPLNWTKTFAKDLDSWVQLEDMYLPLKWNRREKGPLSEMY